MSAFDTLKATLKAKPQTWLVTGAAGFIGCNLNPDPSGGYFSTPPLTDKWWYPFYEKMVELDVPAMIHVSGCCNPARICGPKSSSKAGTARSRRARRRFWRRSDPSW